MWQYSMARKEESLLIYPKLLLPIASDAHDEAAVRNPSKMATIKHKILILKIFGTIALICRKFPYQNFIFE